MTGTGTISDPYIISTPTDLNAVNSNLSAYYELANDIDMGSWGNFAPIGTITPYFTGYFDGKGYKIKNLTVNTTTDWNGLFAVVWHVGSYVKNVKLENCSVSSSGSYVAILVGDLIVGTVDNCTVSGTVSVSGTGIYNGGLVGKTYANGVVNNCNSFANVTGYNYNGGLIGQHLGTVTNSYSTGTVTSTMTDPTFYGGMIGDNTGTVTSSYWDMTTSGQSTSAGGTGKTTAEMKTQSTFTGWNFTTIWGIGSGYPYLKLFQHLSTVNVTSFVKTVQALAEMKKKATMNMISYMNSIQGGIFTSFSKNVVAFMNPIFTTVTSSKQSMKQVIAFMKKISGSAKTDKDIIVNAHTSYIENPTFTSVIENDSHTSYIENPSFTEVRE